MLRGHHQTGGTTTLYAAPYQWRWATTDAGTANTRSTDTGYAPAYTGTATISGTAISAMNPTPTVSLLGSFLYVTGQPAFATGSVPIRAGQATATLAASYGGTTGSGLAITVASGVGSYDIWAQSLSLFAYAAQLFKAGRGPEHP